MAEAARLRALEQEQGRLEEGGGGGGEGDGVREEEFGDGSRHSLHSDDMVSYASLLTAQSCCCTYQLHCVVIHVLCKTEQVGLVLWWICLALGLLCT